MKNNLILGLLSCAMITFGIAKGEMSVEARAKGFVYLHEVDPTIQVSLRYYGNENFVGKTVDGYTKNVLMLTKPTAEALKAVQEDLKKDGLELVVYDGYRPQRAVDHFMRWRVDLNDQGKKKQYYPRVDKERVVELGYVSDKSGHSRGSTVDLTIIKLGKSVQVLQEKKRTLKDGFEITNLDDGTVPMGSSFDIFDEASHHESPLVDQKYIERRNYLKAKMEAHGFKPYHEEWWHYTLKNEPHPANQESSYFDFEIK